MVNSVHIYCHALTKFHENTNNYSHVFNDCINSGNFPDILKYVEITPVFKKGNTPKRYHYRLKQLVTKHTQTISRQFSDLALKGLVSFLTSQKCLKIYFYSDRISYGAQPLKNI